VGFKVPDPVTDTATTYGLAELSGAIFHRSVALDPVSGFVQLTDEPASTQSDGGEERAAVEVAEAPNLE
jgi:hypothetical protein